MMATRVLTTSTAGNRLRTGGTKKRMSSNTNNTTIASDILSPPVATPGIEPG